MLFKKYLNFFVSKKKSLTLTGRLRQHPIDALHEEGVRLAVVRVLAGDHLLPHLVDLQQQVGGEGKLK